MGKRYTPNIGETAKIITSKVRENLGNKPKKIQYNELKNLKVEHSKIRIINI